MGKLKSSSTTAYLAILATSICLNSLGLYLILKKRRTYTNQKLILVHLSICQILLAFSRIIYNVLDLYQISILSKGKILALLFVYFQLSVYYLIMITLTLDRFVATKYPLRYNIILPRRKMHFILNILWLSGLVINVCQLPMTSDVIISIFNYGTLPCLDFTFVCSASVTYGYILHTILNRKTREKRLSLNKVHVHKNKNQFLKMAAAINLRFFLLVVVPDVIYAVEITQDFGTYNVLRTVLTLCWYINPALDPITYVFMQKSMQRELKLMCKKKKFTQTRTPRIAATTATELAKISYFATSKH